MGKALLVLVGTLLFAFSAEGLWCDRTPPGVTVPKTPGDNGFKIVITGDPEKPDKYIPGAVYTGKKKKSPCPMYCTERKLKSRALLHLLLQIGKFNRVSFSGREDEFVLDPVFLRKETLNIKRDFVSPLLIIHNSNEGESFSFNSTPNCGQGEAE